MLALTILYMFVFLIILIIFIEYINNKKYKVKKGEVRQRTTVKKAKKPKKPKKNIPEETKPLIEEKPEPQEELVPQIEPEEIVEDIQPEVVEEEVKEAKVLPSCKYPPFTHVRLVKMGLSDDEAIEFVNELIPQLEEQVPLIEAAINSANFHKIEQLTHGIKGSATNLGTGGVSDLLVEFNTYLKSEVDSDIVKAYHRHFIDYIEALKKQYT